ncbi:GIY-YIG nuclease family protein [Yoonia sp. 208BN28-4]|uniref:GIY-YIG nuclease family protein n=1 Tax=Yoonia sp. 208BN28-4 TaxID=3126505 RepID=UPI0030A9758E
MKKGWIYALVSETCPHIKIGKTTNPPFVRIRQLNTDVIYGPLGPWSQLDIRQVKDVTAIETALHRRLADRTVTEIIGQRELFRITPQEARYALAAIPTADLNAPAPLNKLALQPDFMSYLMALFQNSGLENFRDLQESWTFTLFPSTAGGRYFTINIDRHEVAYSAPFRDTQEFAFHSIVVDQMVKKDPEVRSWLKSNYGRIRKTPYASSWGNSVVVQFETSFDESLSLFQITGFRRAMIAYWYEALLRMQERQTRSFFARFHNYNATSEIFRHLKEVREFRDIIN